MQKLGSFIQTPRQGKRMLNIYHLLRVRADEENLFDRGRRGMKIFEFNQFIQDNNDGEYRIVLILLALNIGYPKIAKHLFPIFQNRSDTWAKFRLEITPKKNNLNIFEQPEFPPNRGEWKKGVWSQGEWSQEELEVLFKTCKAWDKISEKYPLPSDIRLYRDWAKEVGRYSFHWHLAE